MYIYIHIKTYIQVNVNIPIPECPRQWEEADYRSLLLPAFACARDGVFTYTYVCLCTCTYVRMQEDYCSVKLSLRLCGCMHTERCVCIYCVCFYIYI